MTPRFPAFYSALEMLTTDRYFRFLEEGTHFEAGEIGELVLGQKRVIPNGIAVPDMVPRSGLIGESRPVSSRSDESMSFPVTMLMEKEEWEEFRIRVGSGSRWGGVPSIIAPQYSQFPGQGDGDVYFGTLSIDRIPRRGAGNIYQVQARMEEFEYSVRVL